MLPTRLGLLPSSVLSCERYFASSRLEVEALSSGVESSHLKMAGGGVGYG